MKGFILPIDDFSRVAEARRLAMTIAREEGLDEASIAAAELVATEMATNLWKHAKSGEIQMARLTGHGSARRGPPFHRSRSRDREH